jgi:hypothetical protein
MIFQDDVFILRVHAFHDTSAGATGFYNCRLPPEHNCPRIQRLCVQLDLAREEHPLMAQLPAPLAPLKVGSNEMLAAKNPQDPSTGHAAPSKSTAPPTRPLPQANDSPEQHEQQSSVEIKTGGESHPAPAPVIPKPQDTGVKTPVSKPKVGT